MASILPGFEYDIFISYRDQVNKVANEFIEKGLARYG
jgi:hypothetical protein